MGMFDHIKCELPLTLKRETKKVFPKDWQAEHVFQTKDLANILCLYKITKTGQLFYEKVDRELVRTMTEAEERKLRKKKRWVWPYKENILSRKWVKEQYTGTVDFYTNVLDINGNEWWVEFRATFIKGKLVGKLQTIEEKIQITKEQIMHQELQFKQKIEEYENRLWTKVKRLLEKYSFGYWYRGVRAAAKCVGVASNFLASVRLWMLRTL